MRNRFPGKCFRCGGTVEPGKGYMLGKPGDWDCTHEECVPVAAPTHPLRGEQPSDK